MLDECYASKHHVVESVGTNNCILKMVRAGLKTGCVVGRVGARLLEDSVLCGDGRNAGGLG